MYKRLLILLAVAGELFQLSSEQNYDPSRCHNTYDSDTQMFYINGRQTDNYVAKLKEGYVVTRGVGAHKLYPRKIVWNTAREACMRDGGHLAIINSVAEEKVLVNLLQQANLVEAWIGIHDLFEEGDWITLTGESLEKAGFDTWSTLWPNEPDNLGGSQNCGVVRKEGSIDDVVCSLHHPYICEIDIF